MVFDGDTMNEAPLSIYIKILVESEKLAKIGENGFFEIALSKFNLDDLSYADFVEAIANELQNQPKLEKLFNDKLIQARKEAGLD